MGSFHYAVMNWRPIVTMARFSSLEIDAARPSKFWPSTAWANGSASVVSRADAFSGGPHRRAPLRFIRFRPNSSRSCSTTACPNRLALSLPGANFLITLRPPAGPPSLSLLRLCNSRAGTLPVFPSPRPTFSAPPPAHPSTASTPPSPDRSAPDDKPTAPHRSFPPSASRSGRFPRSASTRSHSPQDRFFVSPRISVSRGPGTCRRFFLSLHKSCRPARLTFASEAGAPDRAVDRCLLYSHPHVGAR